MRLAAQEITPQPASQNTRRLSLREAMDLALQNNRSILLAQAGADRAAAEHEQARAIFRPQVLLGSGLAYTKGFPLSIEGSAPSIFQIASSQALFDRNLRNIERQAGQMRRAAVQTSEEVRDQALSETVLTYLDLDRSRRSLEYLRGQSESLAAAREITAERVSAGLEPPLESARAELSAARSRGALAAAENQVALLEFRLRDLTGLPASTSIITEPAEIPLLDTADVASLVARAVNNYPGLRALDEEVRGREFQVAGERGSRWPRVNLVGQYGLFSKINNYDDYFQKFARNNLTVGVSIVVPLYERERYNARLATALAELAAVRYRRDETRAAIERQVRELWGAVQQQSSAREVARLELDLARRALDAVLAQYEEGRVNRLAVEQARAEENRNWIALLNADYDAERARLELLRLTGEIRAALH
jgi:outer membrane protein TolC